MMVLGIDATNIRSGGGLTHLKEILEHGEPELQGFRKVIIWSSRDTLENLPDKEWLVKETHSLLNKSFIFSFIYQIFWISTVARKKYRCDLLFVPGGSFLGSFKTIVTMSQNMLPFEPTESRRFTDWKIRLRFKILYYTQGYTFKNAKGVIFLTNYARNFITKAIDLKNDYRIIPHGINLSFQSKPRLQKNIKQFNANDPFKLLYVSIVTAYKHQWNVVEAVLRLRKEGYPVTLDLVGSATNQSLKKLRLAMKHDVFRIIDYKGLIRYKDLASIYKSADGFVFASSCENMPIILIEAMTAGLPIASSNMGPMKEVLGNAAFYFNPLEIDQIYLAIKEMLDSDQIRQQRAKLAYSKSMNYTWKTCSEKTFEYLSHIIQKQSNENNK